MAYSEHSNLETLRANRTHVTLITMNGFQLRGIIINHDERTVVIKCDGSEQMVYKHAISTIKPVG